MRISHEAIYQALFIEGRGALKRELVACLRTGRALRIPARGRRTSRRGMSPRTSSSANAPPRPTDRAVPGHWEGDLIIGTGRSAIGTLVERSSRSTLLVHLPRLEGWGEKPPVKNGPSLGGYGAIAMNTALTASMTQLPEQLRKTLTWDRGKELSGHAQFALDTGTKVFFADPHSPWQRPTNENTNGLLRQYFPKGTDLSRWSADGPRSRRPGDQQPAPQDPRLADPGRGLRGAATLATTARCCNDRLNSPSIGLCATPSGWTRPTRSRRWVRREIPMTMRWPRR